MNSDLFYVKKCFLSDTSNMWWYRCYPFAKTTKSCRHYVKCLRFKSFKPKLLLSG